jgi:hypothetical protein
MLNDYAMDIINDFEDLVNKLSICGKVSAKGTKGRIITVSNDTTTDKDVLGSWRRSVHEFVGNRTDGSWRSERGSTRMKHSENCRHCRKKLGFYQSYNCECYADMGLRNLGCNCHYGISSKKGYGWCEAESDDYTCRPFYIRLFNVVFVYRTGSNLMPKLPLFQRVRNETNHLFKLARLLLLANTFCTPTKHSELGCVFANCKLPRDILYMIILMSFHGNKKVRDKFKLMLKRKSE